MEFFKKILFSAISLLVMINIAFADDEAPAEDVFNPITPTKDRTLTRRSNSNKFSFTLKNIVSIGIEGNLSLNSLHQTVNIGNSFKAYHGSMYDEISNVDGISLNPKIYIEAAISPKVSALVKLGWSNNDVSKNCTCNEVDIYKNYKMLDLYYSIESKSIDVSFLAKINNIFDNFSFSIGPILQIAGSDLKTTFTPSFVGKKLLILSFFSALSKFSENPVGSMNRSSATFVTYSDSKAFGKDYEKQTNVRVGIDLALSYRYFFFKSYYVEPQVGMQYYISTISDDIPLYEENFYDPYSQEEFIKFGYISGRRINQYFFGLSFGMILNSKG